ncbi:GntR family transcriptional regulator [Microbacterium sp. 2FI]|uniref:GntR family transcriptional regulator n=1 Tax=Microbacterium sp. 2FI TaxID=2502193 RepID=UPI0010F93830|nr:GntR family transcriptional regulator [Microbacterium sp. 2FI]
MSARTSPGFAEPADDSGAEALQQLAGRLSTGYRSVGVMAYDILRDAILNGTLAPGQKLRQETLAELIGVSRLPVRSALIQLEADGLVEFHERKGAVVKSLSVERAREVYEIRTLLELEALRLSMADMTDERLARLIALSKTADAENEGTEFVEARTAFYAELYDAARRPMLWEMIEQLRLKVGRYVLGWRLVGGGNHSHSHEELTSAVAAGDVDHALGVLRAHLESVRDAVIDLLEADSAAREEAATRGRGRRT